MPELPEVETVRTGLERALAGATIRRVTLRRANLRFPFPEGFCEALAGKKIGAIGRRAKYLLFYMGKEQVLIAHLGMTGRFSVCHPAPVAGSGGGPVINAGIHDHVLFHLKDGRILTYNDARRFGFMALSTRSELETNVLLADLGPEPLERAFSPHYLERELLRRSGPVKSVIMDQKLVVGVGNIYASEALFLAGIDPRTPAKKAASASKKLVASIRKVLRDAIASGGSSLRDFVQVSGETGYFQHHFNVYGREGKPCLTCGTVIRNIRMSGRSSFFCAQCQK